MSGVIDNVQKVCQGAIRHYLKDGADEAEKRVDELFKQSIPAAVTATIQSCVEGRWVEPEVRTRRSEMEKASAARLLELANRPPTGFSTLAVKTVPTAKKK